MMKRKHFESLTQDSALGGESWGNLRHTMPYDRPSEYHKVEDFLDNLFQR